MLSNVNYDKLVTSFRIFTKRPEITSPPYPKPHPHPAQDAITTSNRQFRNHSRPPTATHATVSRQSQLKKPQKYTREISLHPTPRQINSTSHTLPRPSNTLPRTPHTLPRTSNTLPRATNPYPRNNQNFREISEKFTKRAPRAPHAQPRSNSRVQQSCPTCTTPVKSYHFNKYLNVYIPQKTQKTAPPIYTATTLDKPHLST